MIGDINSDGYEDFLVTAEWNDQVVSDAGKTYIFYGHAGGWALNTPVTEAKSTILGTGQGEYFGLDATELGDINNDGYDDFAIGSVAKTINNNIIIL